MVKCAANLKGDWLVPKNQWKRDRKIAATNRREAKRREAAKARSAGRTTAKKKGRRDPILSHAASRMTVMPMALQILSAFVGSKRTFAVGNGAR